MNKNNASEVADKITEKTGGAFVYISGYVTKESPVMVECLKCGERFTRTFHHITTHGINCPNCKAKEREETRREKENAERERRKAVKERKRKERERQRQEAVDARIHACPVCGTVTNRKKYCSVKCANKANNAVKDVRRRHKIRTVTIDRDITVEGLYKRDKGICYLCGGKCDLEDYTVINGATITGNAYPSIDHVVPLARGGLHSWENVRLAHRYCNTAKRDKILYPLRGREKIAP